MKRLWHRIRIVKAHIIDKGFNPLYKKWRYHGQPDNFNDPVVPEQGDNNGDEMLNVLDNVIGPTCELPAKDGNSDNFEA